MRSLLQYCREWMQRILYLILMSKKFPVMVLIQGQIQTIAKTRHRSISLIPIKVFYLQSNSIKTLLYYPSKGNIFHENQFYISQVGQSLIPYFGHLVSNDLGDQWTLIQIFDSWMSLPLGFASTITLRTKDHIPCCQCFAFGSMLLTKGVTRGK